MQVLGEFDDFADVFPADYLPWVFRVVLEEWPRFNRTKRKPIENRITKLFVAHLQTSQEVRKLPFFFDPNLKLVEKDSDVETGELDIRVMAGKRPRVYFAFECKCLNVIRNGKRNSQSGEYVGTGGMGCFISGQYDGGGDCGGMLGYVMDNDIPFAVNAINKSLAKNACALELKKPHQLLPCKIYPKNSNCAQTEHKVKRGLLTIYHILLAYN